MTVARLFVVLVSTSEMEVTLANWGVVNPVTEPTGLHEAVQVKFAPTTSEVNATLKVLSEQTGAGILFVKWGEGLTVTIKLVE